MSRTDTAEVPGARRVGRPARRALIGGRERRTALFFVLPILVAFGLFYFWPAINTVSGSLFEWSIFAPWSLLEPADWVFVGLGNYTRLFTSPAFWNAVINTVLWLVVFPVLVTGLSLLIALLIWNVTRGAGLLRSLFVLPMTLSLTAIGVIWKLVYNPDYGTLDALVRFFGANFAIDWGPLEFHTGGWLSNPGALDLGFAEVSLVNFALILPAVWAFTGFGVITFTAGLTAVPTELVEAARVDGANQRQVVRHIVIPLLRRSVVIVGVISVIFALRTFDIVWVMTQGGPANDTEVLAVLLWKQAFAFLDTPSAGIATAMAVLMSAVMIVGAYPYLRTVLGRRPS